VDGEGRVLLARLPLSSSSNCKAVIPAPSAIAGSQSSVKAPFDAIASELRSASIRRRLANRELSLATVVLESRGSMEVDSDDGQPSLLYATRMNRSLTYRRSNSAGEHFRDAVYRRL